MSFKTNDIIMYRFGFNGAYRHDLIYKIISVTDVDYNCEYLGSRGVYMTITKEVAHVHYVKVPKIKAEMIR